jgi:hypothetical protein
MKDDLRFGTTRQAHVDELLTRAETGVVTVAQAIRDSSRTLPPAQREALSRKLAGVIAACEAIRIWLGAGAPR